MKNENQNYPFAARLRFCPKHGPLSDVIEVIHCQGCSVPLSTLIYRLVLATPELRADLQSLMPKAGAR
jgi:hypothetical protein